MASMHECVGGTQNPVVPGRSQRTKFLRVMGVSFMMEAIGYVQQLDRMYNHIHIY